ncbi:MAG: glycoside hydrolase family 16 protein [Hyphomonadaceae bacterium]|nr:glycoside hydrolase family 16 protein [Hyphomonadaceae bacterium]
MAATKNRMKSSTFGALVRRLIGASLLLFAMAGAPAQAATGSRLDRSTLVTTFEDNFDVFDAVNPHDPPNEQLGTWKTWHPFGSTPFALISRTFPNNGEMQVYVDAHFPQQGPRTIPERSHTIRDGVLILQAERAGPDMRRRIHNRAYTSAMISSWGRFSQRYGVFEMRAKFPLGKGLWPAFWLLPDNSGGPPEIDIFEFLGQTPTTLHTTMHSLAGGRRSGATRAVQTADLTRDFHTFTLDWSREHLIYYIDDVEVARFPTAGDMHQPMYMIANLAVGGKWPGAPDASVVFPAKFEIDWIRVHRRAPAPR